MPGFVNAHTHLELTPIAAEPDRPDGPRTRSTGSAGSSSSGGRRRPRLAAEAVGRNVAASLAAGTTVVADTTTAGQSWDAVAGSPLRGVVFAELIGLNRLRGIETSSEAFDWLASLGIDGRTSRRAGSGPGLSPHAPYSTAGWLYQRAAASKLPLSTHLAEMPEELSCSRPATGPLRGFLEDLGAWDDDWEPIGPRPADYIRRGDLRQADWLVAHGDYLRPRRVLAAPPRGRRRRTGGSPSPTARGPTPGSATPRTPTGRCSNAG